MGPAMKDWVGKPWPSHPPQGGADALEIDMDRTCLEKLDVEAARPL